jgi:hypothetical protein
MVRLGGHTISVVRPAGRDPFSGDWLSGATETTVRGCFVQPRSSDEQTDLRDQVVTGVIAFLPAGVDIAATDRVRYAGRTYQVDGDPARWDDAHGVEHHLEVVLREVTG